MLDFSASLIKHRQILQLTQEEVAASLGISQSTYHEWEKGRSPSLKHLPKLKNVFKLNYIDELFDDTEEKK
ncbi:MAG: helix-turn-helix transcriptional regulator [Pseudarcicella sp.]|nr:helix-turn-helix transcriptional regulator [Pseudarcicella sp.]MBP6409776.1 helix-turn-helix transcriptional regulator [Pseudarcicella sp.]